MGKYKVKLKSKREVASNTMEFHFSKPEGFGFKAGQTADYTLIDPPETDEEGNARTFTLSCAPYEDDVMFTTRMEDTAFKNSIKKMQPGTGVDFDAPHGSFTLHNNKEIPAVFLTGGIGVTPARSIILQAGHEMIPHQIFLFYSNKTPEHAAYLDEFKEAEAQNPNFRFIPSMTDLEDSSGEWEGETGFFTKEMLEKYIGDLSRPIYYVCGPGRMLSSIQKTLDEAGIDSDNVRTEEFPGYE